MPRLIVCRNCTESDCTYCNMNILAIALERGYFNSLMREQHTVQIDSELVPVRHGQWLTSLTGWLYCSECRGEPPYETNVGTDYCPNCGAKMDEVREDNYEEPEINPCRGCEDYDGKGGCLSHGGCAERRTDETD